MRTLLADVHALEESMQGKRRTPQGEVNILSTRTFSETFLAPIIADFCSLYPTISVRITLMDRALAPHPTDLILGGYDLAIRTLAVKDSSLVARPLIELPQLLVASPDYLARFGAPRTPLDLADHNCLDPAHTGISFTWELHGAGGRTVVRVSGTPRTNSTSIVRHAALRGLGIALLRSDLIAEHLRDGVLEEVLPAHIVKPKKFYVIYQKDRHQPLRIKVFIDFLTKRMKEGTKVKKAASR
jgi:DNA-binding transcriptional LysR family regulator